MQQASNCAMNRIGVMKFKIRGGDLPTYHRSLEESCSFHRFSWGVSNALRLDPRVTSVTAAVFLTGGGSCFGACPVAC
jgi:hypothetical protein